MKKHMLIYLLPLIFLILINRSNAADCTPTISWKQDSQFYVGETGKFVATINNGCDKTFDVKTEINTERTEGYIKVYKVQSEDETPRPKSHSTSGGVTSFYTSIEKGEKISVVYFVQPDELALSGSYSLFENFYVDDELQESKETKIAVSKPMKITYSIPTQLKLNNPTASSLTINNVGNEIIKSLKVCLSSDNIVSFSEPCKSWENLPSGLTDKLNFYITGLIPGNFQNPIKVDIDYTTFTGLDVSETYYHPSLTITATKTEVPSLSYRMTKTDNSISFQITNYGNGIAYDCLMKLTSPPECILNSSDISNFTQSSQNNTYLILCKDLMLPREEFSTTLNFNPAEIKPTCRITGNIFYKNGFGDVNETKIPSFYLVQAVTTMPEKIDSTENYNWYIIIAIVVVSIVLIVLKVPKIRGFLSQKLHKPSSKEIHEESLEEQKDK